MQLLGLACCGCLLGAAGGLAGSRDAGAPASAVFKPGEAGYACFRAPSLTFVESGQRLLAIVEAYKYHCVSRQWCDIVQKASSDSGATWGPVMLVHGSGGKEGDGNTSSTCFQNVSPTLDQTTGHPFLPLHALYCEKHKNIQEENQWKINGKPNGKHSAVHDTVVHAN